MIYKLIYIPVKYLHIVLGVFVLNYLAMSAAYATSLTNQSITLEQALTQAEAHNPKLASSRWNIGIADGYRQQADLLPNPELSWLTEDTGSRGEVTVQVTQAVQLGGKRGARVGVASQEQQIASLQFEQELNQLRADVIEAFYTALLAQERVELAKQNQSLAERSLVVASTRVKAGRASPIEERRSQVQLAEIALELNRAQRDQRIAYQALSQLMGNSSNTFSRVEGNFYYFPPVPQTAHLIEHLDSTNLLRLATLQINQQESVVALEKANRIPDLSVTVGNKRIGEDNRDVIVLGLSMPLPLFDRNQGNIYAASQKVGQAQDLRNATELKLQAETQQALTQWSTASISVESLVKEIIPATQENLTNITRGFEAGKFGFIDVLDAQRTLLSARIEYVQAATDVIQAWAKIERIYGDVFKLN